MEEKIFQKQLRKGELESLIVDGGGESTARNFSADDLKSIFILEKTSCETYDVLAGNGLVSKNASSRVPLEQLHSAYVGGFRCTRPGPGGELTRGGIGGEAGSDDECLAVSLLASSPAVSFIM